MGDVLHSPATRANLDKAIAATEPHLKPILRAVRDFGVGMLFVRQGKDSFRLPKGSTSPCITIIGDDYDAAHGPDGFHLPSLRRSIRAAAWFAVVSSEPQPHVYATAAALAAGVRANVFLVETRPTHEIQWVHLIQKLMPGRQICLATVGSNSGSADVRH